MNVIKKKNKILQGFVLKTTFVKIIALSGPCFRFKSGVLKDLSMCPFRTNFAILMAKFYKLYPKEQNPTIIQLWSCDSLWKHIKPENQVPYNPLECKRFNAREIAMSKLINHKRLLPVTERNSKTQLDCEETFVHSKFEQ